MPDELQADPDVSEVSERTRVATIRRRRKVETIYTDAACTPRYITELLPVLDRDPCSNPRSTVRSRWSFSLEKGINGLKMPWLGTVFLNWPYSAPMAWVEKLVREIEIGNCTGAVILCKLDTSTKWYAEVIKPLLGSVDKWDLFERVQYDEHPEVIRARQLDRLDAGKPAGDGLSSNNFCSVILHHRGEAEPLRLESIASLWRRV